MTRRADRVQEAIRRLASEILHSELKDPRAEGIITVTQVKVTPDLRLAKIYYSALGDEKKKRLIDNALKSAKKFIRGRLAGELKLRYAIDIMFIADKNFSDSEKINRILDKIHREEKNEENE